MPQKRTTPKGSVYWLARWTDVGGKQRQKSFPTRKEAKQHEDDQNRNLRLGEWIPSDSTATVEELAVRWRNSSETQGTWDERDSLVKNLGPLAHLPARGVRPQDVDEWVEAMLGGRPWMKGRPLSASTVRNKRSQLSALFSRAVTDGVIARTPFTSEVRKVNAITVAAVDDDDDDESVVDRLLTLDQISTLSYSAEHGATWEEVAWVGRRKITIERSTRKSLATAVLLEIGAGTGLRAGEAGGLNIGDWNRQTGMLEVRRQAKVAANGTRKLKTPRSRREVPVPDRLGEILARYLFDNPGPADRPLLLTNRETRWTARAIGGKVRSLRPAIGCDWARFHDLRHFYATSLISGGLPITAVAELLGHTPGTLLKIYAHYLPEDSDRAKRIIDGVLGERGNHGENHKPNLTLVGN